MPDDTPLEQFRQKYPQYDDMSDGELVTKFHDKYYSDMPFDQFAAKVGYQPTGREFQTPWGSTVELPYQPAEQPKDQQPSSSLGRAAHRIAEAAGEGYYDTPPLFNPDSAPGQWLQRHPWVGAVVNEPSKLLGSANAIIRGGQQAVQEAGEALPQVNIPFAGTPAQLGRDIASIPETLLPEVPHALRERYEAGRPAEEPAAPPPPPRPEAQAEQVLTEIASGEPPKPNVESGQPPAGGPQAPVPAPPPPSEAPAPAPPPPEVPESPPPPAEAPTPVPPEAPAADEPTTVSTPAGTKVQVQPEVMELGDLVPSHLPGGELNPDYPHHEGLQPRDRTTAASQAQIRSITANLMPERLNTSPEAGAGAPIVGPDNVVESGNGRTLALGQVYTDPALTAQRDAYRGWLQDQGYDVSGMEAPVLVSRRLTEMDPEARRQFVVEANERGTMGMNAAEQARADADRAGKIIDLWRGSDAGAAGNRDFVRGFMQQLGPEERASMMLPDGSLSPEGVRRIQSAVVAHAYGSDLGPVLDRFLMGDSEGMKTLAGALSDAAGPWAQMRGMAARGEIPPGLDITGDLAQAVDTLAMARRLNRPVSEIIRQVDLDRPPISPNAEAILRMMFRDDAMRKPVGRPILAERLQKHADEATKQQSGPDIFGEEPPGAEDILDAARKAGVKAPEKEDVLFAQAAPMQPSMAGTMPGFVPRATRAAGNVVANAAKERLSLGQKAARGIQYIFSPTSAPGAKPMEYAIRRNAAELAQSTAQSFEALDHFREEMNRLPADQQLDLWHRMETGQPVPPEFQAMHNALRGQLDKWTKKIQSLGKGYLENANDTYLGRAYSNYDEWKAAQPGEDAGALRGEYAAGQAKRPLRGSGRFLKQRTFDTLQEAMDAGLKPVTTNPVEMQLIKLREMQKFYHGTRMADEIKRTGLAKWVPWNEEGAARASGEVPLDDRIFQPKMGPAVAEHFTAFDPQIRHGLEAVAKFLGVNIKTPLNNAILKRGALGYTGRGKSDVFARFGGSDAVLMHEIGHQIDNRFGLARYIGSNPLAWEEAGKLARLRSPTQDIKPEFLSYLLSPDERVANLFHAYWYAPRLLDDVAPHARDMLQRFIDGNPELKQVADMVKPSLQFRPQVVEEVFPGLRHMGAWYAPADVARIFNNYVSPGIRGTLAGPAFDMARSAANALNLAQLGLSGFHATFIAEDTMISKLGLAFQQASRGDIGHALRSLAETPVAVATTVKKGHALRRAYLDPDNATPEMKHLVNALLSGGGRISMDQFYGASAAGSFIKSFRDLKNPSNIFHDAMQMFRDTPMTAPLRMAGRIMQTLSEPLMGWLVPRAKLGVFADLAEDWLRRNPTASRVEFSRAMTQFWDSVDNRMGQMVYDNVFWNKIQKDMAFLSVRSVGWNLGTIREIGGGAADAAAQAVKALRGQKPEITTRMAYTIAMPIVHATLGAILTYLATGHAPQQTMDYFFPPSGTNTNGVPDRRSIPGYIKDVIEYAHAPVQTVLNKTNPLFETAQEIYHNEDYYGGIIYDPERDNFAKAYMEYLLNQSLPFSIRGWSRLNQHGAAPLDQVLAFWGIQPAPKSIVSPEKGEAYQRRKNLMGYKRREKEVGRIRLGP